MKDDLNLLLGLGHHIPLLSFSVGVQGFASQLAGLIQLFGVLWFLCVVGVSSRTEEVLLQSRGICCQTQLLLVLKSFVLNMSFVDWRPRTTYFHLFSCLVRRELLFCWNFDSTDSFVLLWSDEWVV